MTKRSWSRTSGFEPAADGVETWLSATSGRQHSVHVTLGKEIEIMAVKEHVVEAFAATAREVRESRERLFSDKKRVESVTSCPVCGASGRAKEDALSIYGATYAECASCSHYYVTKRPSKEALEQYYATDKHEQSVYCDPRTLKARLEQIVEPKLEWTIREFERSFGRPPKSVLDVGAGSGHFVYASRARGLKSEGIEFSEDGIRFSRENFGIELLTNDFLKDFDRFKEFDVITFWGVIEHLTSPVEMLSAAAEALKGNGGGMVVAEVPRFTCFGTAVQSVFADTVTRHLDPLGHINAFTDSSLATAFESSGFQITSAWYFGMDIYELLTQAANALGNEQILRELSRYIPVLQSSVDLARMSDEMVVAGIAMP